MINFLKNYKDRLYYILVEKNSYIREEYVSYVNEHKDEHKKKRFYHWWILFKLNWHYRILSKEESLGIVSKPSASKEVNYYELKTERKSIEEFCSVLSDYDVISFDIFDTVLYRRVESPNDVFSIMAAEMGHNDFANVRKKAEAEARELSDQKNGHREITIYDIYEILELYYGIDKKWLDREIELEIDLAMPNMYIFQIYQRLLEMKKQIVFTSDMYLPKQVIERMLVKIGFDKYDAVYISNEYRLCKGNGKLQQVLLDRYKDVKIVHVGDNYNSDVKKSEEVGLKAIHNPSAMLPYREDNMDNLVGSFYRSIINTNLNNGLWDKSLYFEHGFRVGGILTVGFCQYINEVVRRKHIDKILFCARDCEIIWKIYNAHFKECANDYIQISRYSIMNVTTERYLYDLANRYILRYLDRNKTTKTIETIFKESGFGYLNEFLEKEDIERFLFPASVDRKKIERFIFKYKDVILEHNQVYKNAAKKYFSSVIGDAKNILVVDIGWSGTCITALKYFIEENLADKNCSVSGVLMCTSRGKALINSLASEELDAYIYSTDKNMDLTRFMMPVRVSADKQDLLHMPLEFMYTSVERSLAFYEEDEKGNVVFGRMGNLPDNVQEIKDMQDGMMYFSKLYSEATVPYQKYLKISPYVAFEPLKMAIQSKAYCQKVYGNFTYDAFTAPFIENSKSIKFNSLFDVSAGSGKREAVTKEKKTILFVTPELIYTGAPRSLLRMCKVARSLNYNPVVWSAKPGPFIKEYEENDIEVRIISESDLNRSDVISMIKSYDMAVCNTIVTDKYARVCSFYIPTVWYIREATNIPDFTRNNWQREYILKHSRNIYCVSDYAAEAIGKFTKNKVKVVHNSVEDEVDLAIDYISGSGDKIRFVQFGTMEYRKGYDVLLEAYLSMPEEYRDKVELYFAGGFINSGTPYCSYLFQKMKGQANVHYLGVVSGEKKKIETLSQMDVVVVASRDESCSLVALEGAMLSKPIIVTENVGAKYIVSKENGLIVKTGDSDSLRDALMYMVDHKKELSDMGRYSRNFYEKYASMETYTRDMQKMFALTKKKHTWTFFIQKKLSRIENHILMQALERIVSRLKGIIQRKQKEPVIVSLTSHPARIETTSECIQTLLVQTSRPEKILLWLSKEQFPNQEKDIPESLNRLQENSNFEIRWVDDDLKPHKKYFYAMQEYPEHPIIIVDDDIKYERTLVERLMKSYRKFPHSISCMRANLMMFKENGQLRSYDGWLMGYRLLLDVPSYQLMATGVGGVLYPPHSISEEAFDAEVIKENCLFTDDLWLKMFSVLNGYPTVVPRDYCGYKEIEGTRDSALWRVNVHQNNNDDSLDNILKYFSRSGRDELVRIIQKDRFC